METMSEPVERLFTTAIFTAFDFIFATVKTHFFTFLPMFGSPEARLIPNAICYLALYHRIFREVVDRAVFRWIISFTKKNITSFESINRVVTLPEWAYPSAEEPEVMDLPRWALPWAAGDEYSPEWVAADLVKGPAWTNPWSEQFDARRWGEYWKACVIYRHEVAGKECKVSLVAQGDQLEWAKEILAVEWFLGDIGGEMVDGDGTRESVSRSKGHHEEQGRDL